MQLLVFVRGILVSLLALFSLLTVVQAPHDVLWKPAVGATEYGHLLVPIALLLALPLALRPPDAIGLVSLGAAVLLASPTLRAIPVGARLGHELAVSLDLPDAAVPWAPPGLARVPTVPVQTREIPAADGTPLRLDWYAGRPGAPLVIAIHGGSWSAGDPGQLPEEYHRLAARGYAVAALTYRLVPAHRHPAQQEDVAAGIAWLKAHADELGFDPTRLILYGRSAGGHLALLHATTADDPAIRGVLALYPVTDFDWSWDHPTNPRVVDSFATITDLLGRRREDDPGLAVYQGASPYFRLRAGQAPMLIAHGGRDELVFHAQSERFVAAARERGIPAYLLSLPWATHGFEANLDGPGGRLWGVAVDRALAKWAPL